MGLPGPAGLSARPRPDQEDRKPGLPGVAHKSEAGALKIAIHKDSQVVSARTSTQPTLPSESNMADTVVRMGRC